MHKVKTDTQKYVRTLIYAHAHTDYCHWIQPGLFSHGCKDLWIYHMLTGPLKNILHREMGNRAYCLQQFSQKNLRRKIKISNVFNTVRVSACSQACLISGSVGVPYSALKHQQHVSGIPKLQVKRSPHLVSTSSSVSGPGNNYCPEREKKSCTCLTEIAQQKLQVKISKG